MIQRGIERLFPIMTHIGCMTATRQSTRDVAGEVRFVFDYKYLHGFSGHMLSGAHGF